MKPVLRLVSFRILGVVWSFSFMSQAQAERLSDHLVAMYQQQPFYMLGVVWETPGERIKQAQLKARLLSLITDASGVNAHERSGLADWLSSLPVTGRIPLVNADPYWLFARPEQDPVLKPGDQVRTSTQPDIVSIVREDGRFCAVRFRPGAHVADYVRACGINSADWAYVAQPDGHSQRVGISVWNRSGESDQPAPGARIWAPARRSGWTDEFSRLFIEFVATQEPAADPVAPVVTHSLQEYHLEYPAATKALASDWGSVGLMQTPTARMSPVGNFSMSLTHAYPYTRDNVFLQPFDWLELGFRYTDINNRLYGSVDFSGHQTYKDKSADVKLRLRQESFYLPELAVGIRDVAGTGLFSGEYVVGSKRTGPLDWSLGLGWGYLGGRADIRNPLGLLKSSFDQRPVTVVGSGGAFPLHTYFHGSAALFGGVQYQTPWDPLLLKLEYDGNNYQHEPMAIVLHPVIPWNFGATLQATDYLDVSAGLERGNTAEIGATIHTDLSHLSMPKLDDPRPVPISAHADHPGQKQDWLALASAVHEQTNWDVTKIEQRQHTLLITVDHCTVTYWRSYLDRAMAVIQRDAPDSIHSVVFRYVESGTPIAEHSVDRQVWVRQHTELVAPVDTTAAVVATAPKDNWEVPALNTLFSKPRPQFELRPGLNFDYFMGGPNGFILYEFAPAANFRWNMAQGHWVQAQIQYDVLNNYNHFTYDSYSSLPRVRTYVRKYVETSRLNMTNMQYTHTGQLGDDQYYSFYGGYLESMFAGAGSEWLYRPFASPWAFGVDLNDVRQRGFAQNFQLLPYRVFTGHASFYWETGWHNVNAVIKAGQYLAGDRGVTVNLGKSFANGVSMGGYFTKTNLSAQQFGEGSFDKGLYVNIPFDALTTRSSDLIGHFLWEPLLRDGGALLARQTPLYDMTQARSDRTLNYAPAVDPHLKRPEDQAIADPGHLYDAAPELAQPPHPMTAQFQADPQPFVQVLTAALFQQGFRNIHIGEDASYRVSVALDNPEVFRPSLAAGKAARTVMNQGPMDMRELSIELNHKVTYNFYDISVLKRYFAGLANEDELRSSAGVLYYDETWRPGDPFWYFGDLNEPSTPSVLNGDLTGMHPLDRGFRDLRGSYHALTDQNWTIPLLIGGGMIAGSSLFDGRAQHWAQQHGQNRLLKGVKNIGNDIPWVADVGIAAAALSSTDPQLSATSYASAEAAISAYVATLAIKRVVGRSRPPAQGSHQFHWMAGSAGTKTDSFPSGHAVVSWAVLTPLAEEYDAPWLYGVAGITNVARVIGQNHWLSDTIASSVLGWGLGTLFWEGGQWKPKAMHIYASPQQVGIAWDLP